MNPIICCKHESDMNFATFALQLNQYSQTMQYHGSPVTSAELTRTRPKCIAFIKLMLCIFPLTTFLSGFPHRLCRTVQKFDRSQGKADAVATWILRHAQQQELSISPNLQPRLTHFTSFGVSLVLNTFTTNIWSNISTVCYMKLCT